MQENIHDKKFAPIVLFAYSRPWHTQKTIEALQKNELATQSDLIIYSDAAKNELAEIKVQEVRDYIKTIQGFNSVRIIERERNWGLANSIIDGVTTIVNQYGTVIVMEDDIVTSKYFLKFMNDALYFYQNQPNVMHISGWNYPIDDSEEVGDTFLWRGMNCWGWATWSNRWSGFNKNSEQILKNWNMKMKYSFNLDGSYPYISQVISNYMQTRNTWAVFWYASIFEKNGLCLNPKFSYVKNIGINSDGTHTDNYNTFYTHDLNTKTAVRLTDDLVENKKAFKIIQYYLLDRKRKILSLLKINLAMITPFMLLKWLKTR